MYPDLAGAEITKIVLIVDDIDFDPAGGTTNYDTRIRIVFWGRP